MKTISNIKCTLLFLCSFMMFCMLSSCVVEIPEEDDIAPKIRFSITGGGLNETMENPPKDFWTADDGTQYLNLDSEVEYKFSYLVSDAGGVSSIRFDLPSQAVVDIIESVEIENTGIQRVITLEGNESLPLTGLTITGTLRIPEGLLFEFNFEAYDYGGQNGNRNPSYMSVSAFSE